MAESRMPAKTEINMRLRLFLIVLVLISSPPGVLSGERLFVDYYRPEMWLRRIIIDRAEFSLERLEHRFRQQLLLTEGTAKVVQVLITTSELDATSNCQCMTDMTYEMWRMFFDEYRDRVPPVAELTVIGHSATMRVRDLEGRVHRKVLKGSDAVHLRTNECTAEILHIQPHFFRPPWRRRLETEADLTFYLQTPGATTAECARSLAANLQRRSG